MEQELEVQNVFSLSTECVLSFYRMCSVRVGEEWEVHTSDTVCSVRGGEELEVHTWDTVCLACTPCVLCNVSGVLAGRRRMFSAWTFNGCAMRVWMDGCMRSGWMDGWMDACMCSARTYTGWLMDA